MFLQFVRSVVPNALTERGLAFPANPISLRTPTTERNASLCSPPHRPESCAPSEAPATVPLATLVLRRVKRVLDRHRMIAVFVLLECTSSARVALALMEMAFAPVLA